MPGYPFLKACGRAIRKNTFVYLFASDEWRLAADTRRPVDEIVGSNKAGPVHVGGDETKKFRPGAWPLGRHLRGGFGGSRTRDRFEQSRSVCRRSPHRRPVRR